MKPIRDVLIIGGGPAGLSAALILGRCRRSVTVCHAGPNRNEASYAMYGFLSRDGICPKEFLEICRRQLSPYANVALKPIEVSSVQGQYPQFQVSLADGQEIPARMIVLATGMLDSIPDLPGIMEFWGKSVFLCPYCDAWEFRDQPVAVYGKKERGPGFSLLLYKWTQDLILCTEGEMGGSQDERNRLEELGIRVIKEPIQRLEGRDGQLKKIIFQSGQSCVRRALFFNSPSISNTRLAQSLGCRISSRQEVEVDHSGLTSVPGVYAAGDASPDIKLAIVAAAQGAKVAYAINKQFLKQENLVLG